MHSCHWQAKPHVVRLVTRLSLVQLMLSTIWHVVNCLWVGLHTLHHMIDGGHDKLLNMADIDLVRACERGDIEVVQGLLRKCKDPRGVRNGGGYDETLLHIACRFVQCI